MSIKILLADDSITIQKVVGIIFGGEEYSLTVVDNGKAAVEKARELDPDVLLIDALMPGMSGYEVCEAVRSNPALLNKPILLLTGSFEPFDENKAKSCGADDFIAKPFESQQVIAKVKELFELGKERASAPAEVMPQTPETVPPPVIETPQATPFAFTEPETTPFQGVQAPTFTEQTSSPFESTSFAPEPAVPPVVATAAATAAPAIWDAFTPEEPVAINPEPAQATSVTMPGDDVFAMVQEEPEPIAAQPSAPQLSNPHIDSQWIPVEEQSFEFEEEKIAELPSTLLDEAAPPTEKTAFDTCAFESSNTPVFEQSQSFGELSAAAFDEPVATPDEIAKNVESPFETSYQSAIESAAEQAAATNMEAFAAAPAMPAAMATATAAFAVTDAVQPTAVTATNATVALTEEQLKSALESLSKEVIERIVWEVVPDLAEVLIKEAIRKIKEGL